MLSTYLFISRHPSFDIQKSDNVTDQKIFHTCYIHQTAIFSANNILQATNTISHGRQNSEILFHLHGLADRYLTIQYLQLTSVNYCMPRLNITLCLHTLYYFRSLWCFKTNHTKLTTVQVSTHTYITGW